MKRLIATMAIAGVAASTATLARAHEVYGQFGTEGAGIGYAYDIGPRENVRAEFDGITFSHNFNSGDLHYDGRANLFHAGLYADFFPAPSTLALRFTAGLLLGGDYLSGDATSTNGTYRINGVTYPTSGQTIHVKASFPTVRPYLGIGFGHSPIAKKGLSMSFDAGVAYGRPHVDFDVPPDIVAAAGQANIDAERQALQDKADRLRFYPVVKIGLTYRF